MTDNTNNKKRPNFFAVDLGATSGRTILGSIEDGRLVQRELTRFPNRIIQARGHYYWDIFALYDEIVRGLKKVADEGVDISSIGIDTWGCDFAYFGNALYCVLRKVKVDVIDCEERPILHSNSVFGLCQNVDEVAFRKAL